MSDIAIVSIDKQLDTIKTKNLFLTVTALNFIWMLFHFTVVFFFTWKLKSVVLVWIFLWIGNFFAFLLDIPIWIVQNYFKAKTLYIIACISQIVAMLIFANFIFQISDFLANSLSQNSSTLWFFLTNSLNIFLLLVASFCYGLTKELQDVTSISYLLNNANPTQYTSIFAKNNLAMWLWSLFWLIVSWVILEFAPTLIIFSVLLLIIFIIYFTSKFFDNDKETIKLSDVSEFKVFVSWNLKDSLLKKVNKIELKKIIDSTRYLFIKPMTIKSWLTLKNLIEETKTTFITTYKVLTNIDVKLIVYWSIIMLLTFWFWDTFASTFLIDFLDKLWEGKSYILLWIIAIPAFGLQNLFWKISEKLWTYTTANIGLALSWISLFLMGTMSHTWVFTVMTLAIINSMWYAACMSLSQWVFLEEYNITYAQYNNLKEIDANAAAAPVKILQNLANVFWLLFGWIILFLLNYVWFFIIFWAFIICFLVWWLKHKDEIKK